jgi:hypothetical protein
VQVKIIVLNPQFLCVRTLADSIGPNGLKTFRMVAGVVVDGIEPIHKALVGVDCTWDSMPPNPALLERILPMTPPGDVAIGLFMLAPFAGATGALSAFPKPMRTV